VPKNQLIVLNQNNVTVRRYVKLLRFLQ